MQPQESHNPPIIPRRALYVFDDELADLALLQDALDSRAASLRLSRDDDVVLEITAALRKLVLVDELVLVGYGRPGELALGVYGFTASMFGHYGDHIASWKHVLAADAKIVLVGCAVGAGRDGADCCKRLAALTQRDVVASLFTVGDGNWNFGGDWIAPEGWQAYPDQL